VIIGLARRKVGEFLKIVKTNLGVFKDETSGRVSLFVELTKCLGANQMAPLITNLGVKHRHSDDRF
jgi:hypothetical protein